MSTEVECALAAARDVTEVGEAVRPAARRLADARGATFVVRDGNDCFYADEDAIAPLWKGQRFPMDHCISGWAMLNAATAVIPDIWQDPRIPQEVYRPTFVRSLAMVPVGTPNPVAAIGVYWAERRSPAADVVESLERLAARVARAIERVGLENAPWAPNFRHADLPSRDEADPGLV
jgi:GAF domain-containing protein